MQPTDAAVLLFALDDLEVTRFEVVGDETEKEAPEGDPRSITFRFTFGPNDYFEDTVLEKRFWHRHQPKQLPNPRQTKKEQNKGPSVEAWSGLVSEPVPIRWKRGKDLTGGLLDLAVKAWAEGDKEDSSAHKKLEAALSKTAVGAVSFFAWFGYVGRRISAEESAAAVSQEREQRAARAAGREEKTKGEKKEEEEEEEDADDDDEDDDEEIGDDDDEDGYPYEIFPDGDTVAQALAEDLWPNAIKYFISECGWILVLSVAKDLC